MKTNTKVFRNRFKAHFEELFKENTDGYINTVEEFLQAFNREANHEFNKKRMPNLANRLADYLQGLPYGFNYVYKDDFIELAKELYKVDELPTHLEETVLKGDNFYKFCANKFIQVANDETVSELY